MSINVTMQCGTKTNATGTVWHALNNLLKPYGQGTPGYIEPVVTTVPANKKTEVANRPSTPAHGFTIYPNPAHHYIEIRWDWFEMGMEDSFTISISSSTGQVIKQLDVSSWQNNVLIFTLTDLTAGVYLIDISSNEGLGLHNEKLIVY